MEAEEEKRDEISRNSALGDGKCCCGDGIPDAQTIIAAIN
jgi:hypothetical protein